MKKELKKIYVWELKAITKIKSYKINEEKSKMRAEKLFRELCEESPFLLNYRNYFKNLTENNSYVTIMKMSINSSLKRLFPDVTSTFISLILNVDRSALSRFKSITPHPDFNEVVLIMDKMIKQQLYPKSVVERETSKGIYSWKPTTYVWQSLPLQDGLPK